MSERSRRWTRNPLGSARRGSNPLGVEFSATSIGLIIRSTERRFGLERATRPRRDQTGNRRDAREEKENCGEKGTRGAHTHGPQREAQQKLQRKSVWEECNERGGWEATKFRRDNSEGSSTDRDPQKQPQSDRNRARTPLRINCREFPDAQLPRMGAKIISALCHARHPMLAWPPEGLETMFLMNLLVAWASWRRAQTLGKPRPTPLVASRSTARWAPATVLAGRAPRLSAGRGHPATV